MLHPALQKTPSHRIPDWLKRAIAQGLTPRRLDAYRQSGWPIKSIALVMNLEVDGVQGALDRWEIP